jgi:hypothetical protein
MKKFGVIASSVLVAMIGLNATAESYYGIGFGSYELETDFGSIEPGLTGTNDIKGVEGYFGFEQNPYVAWELRLGLGLGGDNTVLHLGGESAESDLKYTANSYFSGYFRPQYQAKNVQFYGLLGYSSVSGEMSFDGESEDTSDDGVSYGFGAGVIFSKVNAINVEWKNLAKIDGGEITGVSFNFQRKF